MGNTKKIQNTYTDFSQLEEDYSVIPEDKDVIVQNYLFEYRYLNQSLEDLHNEKWIPLFGYNERYLISNFGRIKALPQKRHLPNGGFGLSKIKLLKPIYMKSHGKAYVYIKLYDKRYLLSRLVAISFVKNPNNYKYIIFKDGNQLNIYPSNLAWVDNETFTHYCKCYTNRKKLKYSKEYAIENCTDPQAKLFYETGDLQIINEYWLEVRKQLFFRNFKEIEAECFDYIVDRLKRFSILGSIVGLAIMYSYQARKKYKKEISNNSVPNSLKREIDESLTQIANL